MVIQLKTPEQVEKMRVASQIAAGALSMVGAHIKIGTTTDEINQLCHDYIIERGGYPASLGYKGFPKSLCTSVNHQVCHGIPSDKKLKDGDIVNVDIVVEKDGWHGDTSKTFIIGKPSILAERLVRITRDCMVAAIKIVKPGIHLGDIGHLISTMAHKERFTVVEEFCGHGIGQTMHEEPQVMHYGRAGTGPVLQAGMVFTIEPMINAGKKQIKILPDEWTVVTKDHMLSAQWEHTILVTPTGYDVLTKREEETDL